jgi:hypothetical protein
MADFNAPLRGWSIAPADMQGHSVTEQLLNDGSIKLTVQVNGGAA